ncbi:MAG: hypothetical protein H6682_18675 [Candidatus Eisenbacteria bacterium]|nr:hypothetical protein [Candidatus Eisenbacteria bacterium]
MAWVWAILAILILMTPCDASQIAGWRFFDGSMPEVQILPDSIPPAAPVLSVSRIWRTRGWGRKPDPAPQNEEPTRIKGRRKKKQTDRYSPTGYDITLEVIEVSDDASPGNRIWFSTGEPGCMWANIRPYRTEKDGTRWTRLFLAEEADSIDRLIEIYAVDEGANWSPPCSLRVVWSQ